MKEGVAILMFDLPMEKSLQRKKYIEFRKSIIKDGYQLLQKSIYYKYLRNISLYSFDLARIKKVSPKEGQIRIIVLTLRQFKNMYVINEEQQKFILNESIIIC